VDGSEERFYSNILSGGDSPVDSAYQMHAINLMIAGISWHWYLRYEATEINDLILEMDRFLLRIYQFLFKRKTRM